jgi:hypothetical protein
MTTAMKRALKTSVEQARVLSVLWLTIGVLAVSAPAWAHHGDADRYDEKVVSITGTLVELQLVNPHSIIVLDVTEGGKTLRWQAELGGTQQLVKQFGWTKNTIKVGDKLTVTGRRAKDGAPYMNLTERSTIVMTDTGKQIYTTETAK